MPNIIVQEISQTIESNFMPYAMSVIVSRAIPEIDGFKPAHRKLLYMMYKMNLLTGHRVKSADVVGQTMRLNPHGDGAIYETLVRLTRGNDSLLHPFIDSKGNFGKHYTSEAAYAASRYTEVKLDTICQELFRDIDKDCVDFTDNYNGTMKEPMLFPTTFPNVLVTANEGIAVGMTSKICSFNLNEVVDTTIKYIKNPNHIFADTLLAPDFTTGGELLYNRREMETIYETGRGSFRLRAKYRYDKKNSSIEIYEIPYTTTIEVIIKKIIELVKNNKIRDINDVRDEIDKDGFKLTIDIKRSANPEVIMQKLYASTTLLDSFACNFNILIGKKPLTLGIKGILDNWITFRSDCIYKQTAYELKKKEEQLHLLVGLSKILLDIDKAIRIIRGTEQDNMVIPNLMSGFGIEQAQANFIAEIKLRNLNKAYILDKIKETDSLKAQIEDLKGILSDDKKVKGIICDQLKDVSKKYGKPRKTAIVYEEAFEALPDEELIDDYAVKLFFTEHNYIKKIPLTSLRSYAEQHLKDEDKVVQEIEISNRADILFFSNKYCVYKLRASELSDTKASGMGEYTNNLLGMDEDERIVFIAATLDYTGYLILAFENGKFAKIELNAYATKTRRKKLLNAYSDESKLIFADHISVDRDYITLRGSDKAALFNTSLIAAKTTKNTIGVSVMTLRKNSLLTAVYTDEKFISEDKEYYRIDKIPSAGHFITEKDEAENKLYEGLQLKI